MKQMQLAELGPLADDVRNGETIELRDGNRVVGHIVRVNQAGLEAHVQQLAREGRVRLGSGKPLSEEFFTEPLPQGGESVLDELLRDRHKD